MRRLVRLVQLGGLLWVASCSIPTDVQLDSLRVQVTSSTLVLENRGWLPIYTFVVERNTLALASFAACLSPTQCEPILPGARVEKPLVEIPGYTPAARELVVSHWQFRSARGGGYDIVNSGTLVVRLP